MKPPNEKISKSKLKSLIREGLGFKAMAKRLGCSRDVVTYAAKKYGLKTMGQKQRGESDTTRTELVPINNFMLLPVHAVRLEEIRRLRRLFDSSGEQAVYWDKNGVVRPGQRYPQPGIYKIPPWLEID